MQPNVRACRKLAAVALRPEIGVQNSVRSFPGRARPRRGFGPRVPRPNSKMKKTVEDQKPPRHARQFFRRLKTRRALSDVQPPDNNMLAAPQNSSHEKDKRPSSKLVPEKVRNESKLSVHSNASTLPGQSAHHQMKPLICTERG